MRNAYLVFNGALLYFQIPKRQGKKPDLSALHR